MKEYSKETEWFAIDTAEIQQLDIDDATGTFWSSDTAKMYEGIPYYASVKKKMPHYFIKTGFMVNY